jgi:broad specificity phosphatase PhoE
METMPNPSQHTLPRKPYRYVTAGVVLAGASVIAVSPVTTPGPDGHVPGIQLTAGEEPIVIDFVRHGTVTAEGSPPLVTATVPGPPLTDVGQQQAQDVGDKLFNELGGPHGVAGIFAGQEQRMPETAAPFATLEHMTPQILPGLNEIDGGVYEGDPIISPGGILYRLTVAAWPFGLEVAQMPGSKDLNGVAFDERFNDAVDTMYNTATADPVVSANGNITDVAYSGEAAITAWTLMNVNNPDLSIFLPLFLKQLEGVDLLPDAGVVTVKGDPEDGWTLVSFNGQSVPPPGLLTELFVDFRDLITAPQTAEYHIFEAILTGDPTAIEHALQAGLQNVGAAIVQFPQSVINDIVDALNDGTDGGGQAAGEAGATLSDAFASLT